MHPAGVLVCALLLVSAGCAAIDSSGGSSAVTTTAGATTTQPPPGTSPATSTAEPTTTRTATARQPTERPTPPDPCGNALGNGDEIVDGPATAAESGDNDNPFRSLTVHPTDPDTVLLGTERNGFLRSTDGGASWSRFRYGLRHRPEGYPEIYDIAYARPDPSIVVAATTLGGPGPLVGAHPSAGGGVYRSGDGGETWERRNCGIQAVGGRTTSVWVDPTDPSHAVITVAAGTVSFEGDDTVSRGDWIPGGIFTTSDGGDRWTVAAGPPALNRTDYVNLVGAGDTLYATGWVDDDRTDVVVVRSTDRGASWSRLTLPVVGPPGPIAAEGGVVHAIVGSPTGGHLLRSEDRGATWTVHRLRSSGYAVTAIPGDPDTVLYATAYEVHRSSDGLATSRPVLELPSETRPADIAVAPTEPDRVYLVTQGYLVYRSDDRGRSWTRLGNLREDVLSATG